MKNSAPKILFSTFGLFFSTLVSATSTCLPIQGTVQTQSFSDDQQVGQITMTSSRPLAFKRAFGEIFITGGIHGTKVLPLPIFTPPNTLEVHLEHQMGFPGVGSINSIGDIAHITLSPDAEGNMPITETVPINAASAPYGGAFTGWTGTVTATGTVNDLTRTNIFTYSGQICKP